jgi:hypothetical protein
MAEDWALMAGEVHTRLSRRALASRLAAAGLRAEVRESCHYEGGRYIRVYEADDFTLERVGSGEYLAHADADTMEQLHQAAARVSGALTGLGIRHRFELSHRHSEAVHYLHHLWPRAADA